MAGAVAELGRWTLAGEFWNIDPRDSKVLLVQGGDRILRQFPEPLARYADDALRDLGVTVRTNTRVKSIEENGVQ